MNHLQVRFREDTKLEVGVDEAGRGCLWGPLYAAAVIWPPEEDWLEEHREIAPSIKDSKKLSAKKRKVLAEQIKAAAIDYGIGSVSAKEIDQGGMTFANRLAFVRALEGLSVPVDRVLIDGCLPLRSEQLESLKIDEQETIVDGDALYLPIAAASILAKVARDEYIEQMCVEYPELIEKYGLDSNKGYGSKQHMEGIKKHGITIWHRRSFGICKEYV
jgi:ribonuclease HII